MIYLKTGLFVLILLLSGCSVQDQLARYDDTRIIFGSGGGYSGREIQYTLMPDGNVTLYDNISRQTTEVTRLGKKETLEIFQEMDEVMMSALDFDHPGLTYTFIRQVKGNKTTSVVWGAREPEVPSRVREFMDYLMASVGEGGK